MPDLRPAQRIALLLRRAREATEILGARWYKIPERHRRHYRPAERFRIRRIKNLLGLSQYETARMFRVSADSIAQWEVEAGADREVALPRRRGDWYR